MRKLGILLVLLAVLAAAAIFAVSNLNGYLQRNRAWLAERVSTALGREVTFKDVGVSFRGGLGARVSGLSISDDPAFSDEEFLRVDSADVAMRILPALRGRYEVRKVVLDAPRINVIRTSRGYNFESIGALQKETPPSDSAPSPTTQGNGEPGALPLLVSLVNIRDGRVRVIDRTTTPNSEIAVDDLDVSASDLGFEEPIALELAAALLGANEQNLHLSGTIGPLGSAAALERAPVEVEAKLGPLVIDRLKRAALVGPAIPAELASPDPVEAVMKLSGVLGDLQATLSLDASKAAISFGQAVAKGKGVPLRVRADVRRRGEAIEVSSLEMTVAAAQLKGKGTIGTGGSLPVDLELRGESVPLDGWAALVPAASAIEAEGTVDVDIAVKGDAAGAAIPAVNGTLALAGGRFLLPDGRLRVEGVDTVISLRGDRVEMPATEIRVNGLPVQVAATVKSLRELSTEFSLAAPEIALAGLGASDAQAGQAEVVKDVDLRGEFRAAENGPGLDVSLRSSAGNVRDVAYENLRGDARLRGKKLTVERVSVSCFGGNVVGAGSVDGLDSETPEFAFRGKIGGMDVAALIERFAPGGAVEMSGRLDATLDVRGRGATWEVARQAMTGGGSVATKDGVLEDVNIADEVMKSITGVQGLSGLVSPSMRKKYPEIFTRDDTPFDVLRGNVSIADGVAAVEQLELAAHDYRLDGKGDIGLDNRLDLRMVFTASQRLSEDLSAAVKPIKYVTDDRGRFQLPVVLRGSIPSVRPQPDLDFLSKRLAGALVDSGIEKGLDALFGKKKKTGDVPTDDVVPGEATAPAKGEDRTQKLIRKGLEGLFGGSKKGD